MVQSGRVVFEGEDRRNHRRRRRPCRGRSEDGKTFFDVTYSTVNNNYYYICGGQPSGIGSTIGGGLFGSQQKPHQINDHLQNTGINVANDEVVADEYDRPDRPSNPIVNVADSVQSTVVGVTNAVTGTIQDVVRPLINSQPLQQPEIIQSDKFFGNHGGLFFGLFDGSFINNFFNKGSTTPRPIIVKPVSESYNDIEDPNQNYKPGPQTIGYNPVDGNYAVGSVNYKPSNILKQINRGIDSFVNPFLELLF